MPITLNTTTSGQDLYVMFSDGTDATAVDLTEGADDLEGVYSVADSAIVSAGLAAGTYSFRVFAGTAASKSPSDPLVGVSRDPFVWNGTKEIATLADLHLSLLNAR